MHTVLPECSCCLAERVLKRPTRHVAHACRLFTPKRLSATTAADARALMLLELPADESPELQRAMRWSERAKQGLPVLELPSYRTSRSFTILEMPEGSPASTAQRWPSSSLLSAPSAPKMAIMVEGWEGDETHWAQQQEAGRFEDMVVLEEPHQRRSYQQPAAGTGDQGERATPLDARASWRRSSSFRPHISGELQQTSSARGRPQRPVDIKQEELLLLMARAYMELAGLGEQQLPPKEEHMGVWMEHLLGVVNSGDADSVLMLFGHMQRDHPSIRLADIYSALVHLREKT